VKPPGLCYSFLVHLSPKDRTIENADEYRWHLLQKKIVESKIARAFDLFRQFEIEPLLIKGWAAQRSYPQNRSRTSSDIDLAVAPVRYQHAEKLYRTKEFNDVGVDLHKGLRHLDTVDWDDLFANSITIDVDGVPIRILRPEDHLRVLCVHWLTDGGAYKERLWDIYYAVANRPDDFDWERCMNIVSETRRRWVVCVIGLAHRYLDLNIDDLPFADEARSVPHWLVKAVEREWASDVRLAPIHVFLSDPKMLMKQIRKRIPPNPIQAMIDVEGSIDSRIRFHYQIGSVVKRTVPSAKRVIPALFHRVK